MLEPYLNIRKQFSQSLTSARRYGMAVGSTTLARCRSVATEYETLVTAERTRGTVNILSIVAVFGSVSRCR